MGSEAEAAAAGEGRGLQLVTRPGLARSSMVAQAGPHGRRRQSSVPEPGVQVCAGRADALLVAGKAFSSGTRWPEP